MRLLTALIATVVAVAGCKAEGDAAGSASASAAAAGAQTAGATAEARVGGQVVTVGAHSVELKIYERGLVEAWVFDASGKLVADEKTKLSLRPPSGGAGVECAFDAPSMRLVGRTAGDAKIPSGPLEVELSLAGGASAKATLEAPVLLRGPSIGGTLVAAGKYSVEIAASADGKVQALLRDAAGELDGKVKLELKVGDITVDMAWDNVAKFVGQAKAGADFAAGPVSIVIDGNVVAKLPKLALRAEAKHDGRLIAVGGYTLEIVAEAGALIAYVFDAKAAVHAAGDLDISIGIGGGAAIKLKWDAPSASYKAAVDGDFNIDAELTAIVKAGGEVFVAVSPPKVKAALDLDAEVDAKVDVDVDAKAKAKVDVKVPTPPSVKVEKSAGASAGGGKAKAKAKVGVGF
ncbi:MAG: hypothetical protein HOV80_10790 [Polyangiaceae bacterium]|nr:hypothetical protein [Polyangiaceae bacterium]